jgi:hypothetical protein
VLDFWTPAKPLPTLRCSIDADNVLPTQRASQVGSIRDLAELQITSTIPTNLRKKIELGHVAFPISNTPPALGDVDNPWMFIDHISRRGEIFNTHAIAIFRRASSVSTSSIGEHRPRALAAIIGEIIPRTTVDPPSRL